MTLLSRDSRISLDNLGVYAAHGFNAERKGSNVKKQNAFNVAAENAALNCRADCNTFVGVDALEGLFACECLNCFLNGGDSSRTADHKDFVKLRSLKT